MLDPWWAGFTNARMYNWVTDTDLSDEYKKRGWKHKFIVSGHRYNITGMNAHDSRVSLLDWNVPRDLRILLCP